MSLWRTNLCARPLKWERRNMDEHAGTVSRWHKLRPPTRRTADTDTPISWIPRPVPLSIMITGDIYKF